MERALFGLPALVAGCFLAALLGCDSVQSKDSVRPTSYADCLRNTAKIERERDAGLVEMDIMRRMDRDAVPGGPVSLPSKPPDCHDPK
jgi:hypothetical protein